MINNRRQDLMVEREIAKFLDENLYSNKEIFKSFKRTDDKEEQLSGSDVIISTCDGILDNVIVDEKVASRYANSNIGTFALELSFINKDGVRRQGWFLDCEKKTQYYLLGWIINADIPFDEKNGRFDTNKITKDNIKEMEWVLVSRKKIQEFLETKGWTLDRLALQDKKIRENGGVRTKEFINDVSFRFGDAYVEKPINILLKKLTYIELSEYHGVLKKDSSKRDVYVDGNKILLRSKIENDSYTQFLYDHYDIQNKEITETEVPIPQKGDIDKMNKDGWNILLICGKSGSGKSTILKHLYGDIKPMRYDYEKAVISQFPRLSEEDACDLLSSIGLSSVPAWLRKPNELSNGERARLDIAKAIYDADGGIVVLDEYTSVVNRAAAKSMSYALQRYVRQKDLKVIVASCHFDIVEWLQADYIFNLEHRDENGEVELERVVYNDDEDYNAFQSIREIDSLSEAVEINVK